MPIDRENLGKNRSVTSENDRTSFKSIFDEAANGMLISNIETGVIIEINPTACKLHGLQYDEIIGKSMTALIAPADQGLYNKYVEAIRINGISQSLLRHHHQDNSILYIENNGKKIDFHGKTCILSILHDVSPWVSAKKALQEKAEIHEREQSTLLDISQTLASSLKLNPCIVLDQLRVVIEYVHGVLFTIEDGTLIASYALGSRLLEKSLPFSVQLADPSLPTNLFNEWHPTRIDDVWSDVPKANSLRTVLEDKSAVLLKNMHAWMWVPIIYKDQLVGGLGIAHPKKNFYTTHHADLALTVANQAAIAMVNAELFAHAQDLAALQERQRLARDLHDTVNQSLFSAGLIADVLPHLMEKNPEEAKRQLENVRRLMLGAQADMRLLMTELRPNAIIDTSLEDLFGHLRNSLIGRINIPVKINVKGEINLPGEVKHAFYRICQEGFNNIARHAEAQMVEVILNSDRNGVNLSIIDNGSGFDANLIPAGHYGILMMRERAEAVGASFAFNSQTGKGTTILIHWPGKIAKKVEEV
jgi:PAS domain S-box-containing protein